jgi:hypothetical protein
MVNSTSKSESEILFARVTPEKWILIEQTRWSNTFLASREGRERGDKKKRGRS